MAEIQTTQLEVIKISSLPEATAIGGSDYAIVNSGGVTKKASASLFKGLKGDTGAIGPQGIQGADGKAVEITKDTTYIKWRYVGDSTWNNLVALADLKGDSASVDLTNYALKSWVSEQIATVSGGGTVDLSTYALKTELHAHANKIVLDGITSTKITEWNNKSSFSGSYVDLTNKPTIPTVDVTKSYVDTGLSGKVDKVTGKSLISDTEITRLASVNNYNDTEVRGLIDNIKTTWLGGKKLKYVTQSQYDLLTEIEKNDTTIVYIITDRTVESTGSSFPFIILSSEDGIIGE